MFPRPVAARALLACVPLLAPALAQAPPGYKTYENKLQAVTFFYPVAYEEVPLPPTEQVTVARFVMQKKPEELAKVDDRQFDAAKPQLAVFHFALPAPTTGAGEAGGSGNGESAGDKPVTLREAMEAQSRVASWAEFCERLGPWRLEEDTRKPGCFQMRYTGQWNGRFTSPAGYLIKKQEGSTVFGVWGVSLTLFRQLLVRRGRTLPGDSRTVRRWRVKCSANDRDSPGGST
ncbi:MAG: hypothetical protein WAT39_00700, partial [Planctomycetota bacterium]